MLIKSITMSGFQVFDTPQTIPISRLTLFFGPNSAGKSSLEDAIALFGKALRNKDIDRSDRFEFLSHDWRRHGPNVWDVSSTMSVGLLTSVSDQQAGEFLNKNNPSSDHPSKINHALDITFTYSLDRSHFSGDESNNPDDWQVWRSVSITYDGTNLFRWEEIGGISLNLSHPVLAGIKDKEILIELAMMYPSIVEDLGNGEYRLTSNDHICRCDADRNFMSLPFELAGQDAGIEITEKLKHDLSRFLNLASTLYQSMVDGLTFESNLAPASRTTPSARDLTMFIDLDDCWSGTERRTWGVLTESKSQYADLAESFLKVSLSNSDHKRPSANSREELAIHINRALADHLFLERGYRIDCEYKAILDQHQFENLRYGDRDIEADGLLFLVRLFLVDTHGRAYSFTDVGSGLGYVLPVLCAIYDRPQLSLIQQPELHLHPALQAALGDVLIDAIGHDESKHLMVETHSEHLLLRILKRIRQCATNSLPNNSTIQSDDISVVYFNPAGDGITKVRQLRIAPDGEFMDRWPRGFFDERDQELWDE